jgi:DNA polymerase-3 subunit delta
MAAVKVREASLMLVHGEESLLVRQRAKAVYEGWCAESGGMDHEVVDAASGNADEALRALGRLREALQTLPFFGGSKVIWFQGCTFLGDDRTAVSSAVTASLASLAEELAAFSWEGVRLVISAGKVDKRRVLFKILDKLGKVEEIGGLSADQRDWAQRAEQQAAAWLGTLGKDIEDRALATLVASVGPNLSLLRSETDKLATYVGARSLVEAEDVAAVVVHNKQARAFALGDALGDRDLPRLLRALDEELWLLRHDKEKSEIGILYGLVGKVRSMLLAKELVRGGWVGKDDDYQRFKGRLAGVPEGKFPADRRFNPAAINAYVLFRAAEQSVNWTESELVSALGRLLECNLQLISGSREKAMVLQRALIDVVGLAPPSRPARRKSGYA